MRFHFGGHVLDLERRELLRDGEPVALEPRVFDLLVHLARNRDRVVSKDDLIETVWGGRIVSDAAIDSQVRAARLAVADSGTAQRVIRTFPRKGVRFIAELLEETPPIEPRAATAITNQLLTPPDKPSIAVLAFANMSGDSEQEYFSDGIAEDIITALSRYPSLLVIARNSSFTYKGRVVDAREIGRDLGVRYVLEGSVRKSGDRIRVTAQLIEAETGIHSWAQRYDRKLSEIFAVQDEITDVVTTAIAPAIADAELKRAMRKHPENLDSWAAYQHGLWHLGKSTSANNALARQFFQRAIDLDGTFAGGYRGLAIAQFDAAIVFHELPLADALSSGEVLVRHAAQLDGTDAEAQSWLGRALSLNGDYEGASAAARRALAMSPNLATAHGVLGAAMMLSGRPREGLASLEHCIRLGPRDPFLHVRTMQIAMAHYFDRNYVAAAGAARQAVRLYPDFAVAYCWLAAALGQIGEIAEASQTLRALIESTPAALDIYVRRRVPWIRPQDHAHLLEGLDKAGWQR